MKKNMNELDAVSGGLQANLGQDVVFNAKNTSIVDNSEEKVKTTGQISTSNKTINAKGEISFIKF